MALGGALVESGELSRRVTLTSPADGAEVGQSAGNIQIKLRQRKRLAKLLVNSSEAREADSKSRDCEAGDGRDCKPASMARGASEGVLRERPHA